MAQLVNILYTAALNQPAGSPYGWVPRVTVDGRCITDTYMPKPLEYDEALARAKAEAREEASRWRGDYDLHIGPGSNP